MSEQDYKKVFGTILFDLSELNYGVKPLAYNNYTQYFMITNNKLEDYIFVLGLTESEGQYLNLYLNAIPCELDQHFICQQVRQNLLKLKLPLEFETVSSTEFSVTYRNDILVRFLKHLKKYRKVYTCLYNCDLDNPDKIPSKFMINKIFKQIKSR